MKKVDIKDRILTSAAVNLKMFYLTKTLLDII